MRSVLLLGAGFSRNWGGWLASEAFEYLIGCPEVDADIAALLWKHRRTGGFESALNELQSEFARAPNAASKTRRDKLQAAVQRMFHDMDKAFAELVQFEPQNEMAYLVRTFLCQFDEIFTLNQDLLLERHYLNDNVALSSSRRWTGWQLPGMTPTGPEDAFNPGGQKWTPVEPTRFQVAPGLQPYIKLHGSSNWIAPGGGDMLIVGGNKTGAIKRHPILDWYGGLFVKSLEMPNTRLMVIGYSFCDDHINEAIAQAVEKGHLTLFLIDPLGVDVIDKNRNAAVYAPDRLMTRLSPRVSGASRRTLREIFGSDRVEHAKVMRFFAG